MKKNILFLFGFIVFINSFYVFGGSGEFKFKGRLSKLKEKNPLQFYKYTPRSPVTNKLIEILAKEKLAEFAGVGNGAEIKLTDLISRELFHALGNNSQFAQVALFDSYCFDKREIGSIEVSDDGNYLVIVS